MRRKSLMMLVLLSVANLTAWAQGPNASGTYYQKASGKKGASLKTALAGIINPHTNIGYDGLYEAYKKTDTRADGYVRDWYSNSTHYRHGTDKAGNYSKEGDCYNREHSVPQSWFGSGVIKSDIVHVIPTDGYVNNRRSNYPLAEVNNVTYASNNNYSKLGSCKTEGYSGTVFEPNDEIKGDMARMYFYMVTCYESQAASWGNNVFSSSYNGFTKWALDMLMRWSKQDPIDAVEIARNNAVYEVQKNRNPFVDYPGLEDYIWGSKQNVAFSYDSYDGTSGGTDVATVAMPVITPDEGTYYNKVDVTISCATDGATIYYTTDGADASEQSILYEGTFTLTSSATVKAVAIKDGLRSVQAIAEYVINGSSTDVPVEGELVLNNEFFNYSASGTINKDKADDLVGSANGITVVYSLGTGSQRYATDTEIRLYTGNKLTVSASAEIAEIVFTIGKKTDKLYANTGSVNEYTWTGSANTVEFTSGGNLSLAKMKVSLAQQTTGINAVQEDLSGQRVIYNLRGQRVAHPTKGLYIIDGKKVMINR